MHHHGTNWQLEMQQKVQDRQQIQKRKKSTADTKKDKTTGDTKKDKAAETKKDKPVEPKKEKAGDAKKDKNYCRNEKRKGRGFQKGKGCRF